ncbi:MAG: T9SS type A sorting domain-containing protein [Candidatus Marinimicrobia bacterium]|jgi:photosystem II stability/assembly factor-like uncharacterized protein|nr:T9SS type A sorting domain-containing protein [Candidatus Neomarinimicrobiota bacterium]
MESLIGVSNYGKIIKTTDYGQNWHVFSEIFSRNINDVYFNNLITGYACGDNGLILKTENAGESWTGIDLNIEEDFYSIYSIEDDTLWIVGSNNTVLKSIDNGITWNAIIIQDQYNYTWKNIQFTSPLIGYLSGGINDYLGDIFKTTDGGNSWEIINPENSGFLDDIQSMQFLNDSVGWIYSYFVSTAGQIPEGYPYLYKTTNGGVNWEDLVPRQPFFFLNDSIGWGSSTGYTYITYDGGASWNNPVSQYSALTYKFLDNQNGWAAGEYGYLGYTNNGGDNWTDFNGYNSNKIYSIDFHDSLGMAVGTSGGIFRTTDSGESWVKQSPISSNPLSAVKFKNTQEVFGVGSRATLYKSIDSGETWESYINFPNWGMNDIFFLNDTLGWLSGGLNGQNQYGNNVNESVIRVTLDGGITWQQKNTGTDRQLNKVIFFNANTGIAIGNRGIIIKSNDGGNNWIIIESGTINQLKGMTFISGNTGWIVGKSGTILKTNDGGETWSSLLINEISWELNDIYFINENEGWIIGNSNKVLHTVDGGDTWLFQRANANPSSFNSIFMLNTGIGWIVGNGNKIMKTNDFGGGDFELEINDDKPINNAPQSFSIKTYPNPFNNKIKIQFNKTTFKTTTIDVFDLMGRHVKTLSSQTFNLGMNTIYWTATEQSSGIYFIILKSGNKFVTKKVLLIK